ncbi:unnamed protein product [Boreogadus saida]
MGPGWPARAGPVAKRPGESRGGHLRDVANTLRSLDLSDNWLAGDPADANMVTFVTMFCWFSMVISYLVCYVRHNREDALRHMDYLKSLPGNPAEIGRLSSEDYDTEQCALRDIYRRFLFLARHFCSKLTETGSVFDRASRKCGQEDLVVQNVV